MTIPDRVLLTKMAEAIGPKVDIGDGRRVVIALDNAGFDVDDVTRLLHEVIERVRRERAQALVMGSTT